MSAIVSGTTNVTVSGQDGVSFKGPLTQGAGAFAVDASGNVTTPQLAVSGTGAAIAGKLIVGNGLDPTSADSCIVACGNRVDVAPQQGVHLGAWRGTVQGITIATKQSGSTTFGGEVAWQIQNQTSHRAKIYYSYGSDTMQFNTTDASLGMTEGTTSAILSSVGLLVTPGAGQAAESSLVAAGFTPIQVTRPGIHLGQLRTRPAPASDW